MKLPRKYFDLTPEERKTVREEYARRQAGNCLYCGGDLYQKPPARILRMKINRELFPKEFFYYPIHLQHSHKTGLTEGAVHARCNAVLWQYHKR